jgi:phage gpG-like protein
MIKINVNVNPGDLANVGNKLDHIKSVLSDFTPELEIVGQYLVQFFENEVFETEGAIFGEPWQMLMEATQAYKNRLYPGRGILEETGTLRYGFELMTTSQYCLVSNPVEYGKYHMTGTSRMPARVFMKIDDERAQTVGEKFSESLYNRLKS